MRGREGDAMNFQGGGADTGSQPAGEEKCPRRRDVRITALGSEQ